MKVMGGAAGVVFEARAGLDPKRYEGMSRLGITRKKG